MMLLMLKLFTTLQLQLGRLVHEDRAQGLSEYALVLALIAVVAVATLTLVGGKVSTILSTVAHSVP